MRELMSTGSGLVLVLPCVLEIAGSIRKVNEGGF